MRYLRYAGGGDFHNVKTKIYREAISLQYIKIDLGINAYPISGVMGYAGVETSK